MKREKSIVKTFNLVAAETAEKVNSFKSVT